MSGLATRWASPVGAGILAIALLVLVGAGCQTVRQKLVQHDLVDPAIKQAAFDHRCAEDQIRVVRHTSNWLTLEMDVCGKLRRYQYITHGPDDSPRPIWVDTTQGFPPNALPSETR